MEDIFYHCDDYMAITQASIIVARDHSDNKLYRAQLIGWDYDVKSKMFRGSVRFMDSGRSQKITMSDLFLFQQDIEQAKMPARCFECRLAEIQPSTANVSGGHMWDRQVIDKFSEFVLNRRVIAEVIVFI